MVAVRGLHAFAAAEGLTREDPARPVRPPASPRRLPKAISVTEIERLLQAAGAGDGPAPLRDRALLELLYGTGARISEAIGLDIDDLDLALGDDPARVPAAVRVPAAFRLAGKGGGSGRRLRSTPGRHWRRTWSGPGPRSRWRPAAGRPARRCS